MRRHFVIYRIVFITKTVSIFAKQCRKERLDAPYGLVLVNTPFMTEQMSMQKKRK